ncbi:hypothetical protein GCM10020258_49330 [Sphingomonas yabuuchiae]
MIRRFAPIAALAVAGCMTAPLPPPTIASATATGAFASLPTAAIGPVPNDWWRLYDDPALDRLVQASLAANADLRVAYANLDGARGIAASACCAAAANHDRERGDDRQQRDAAKRVVERADHRLRSCPDRKLGYRPVRPPALGRAGGRGRC